MDLMYNKQINKQVKIIGLNTSEKILDDFCQLYQTILNKLKIITDIKSKNISSIHLIDKDATIILLQADPFIIEKIKFSHSKAEILFVNLQKDYQVAIDAFRNGIDDVIHYPFEEKELLSYISADNPNIIPHARTNLKGLIMLTHIDDVTKLFNQRKLYSDLEFSIKRHQDINEIFSILFIDIDHFKYVNDNFGHLIGSSVLVEISKILKKMIRESDLIYRYGGDEFVIILPNIGFNLANKVAFRILKSVEKTKFKTSKLTLSGHNHNHNHLNKDQQVLSLTVSIGIAEYPKDAKTKEEILDFADRMMYQAKGNGRSQVYYTSTNQPINQITIDKERKRSSENNKNVL
ncbi:MAG: GGDEF domain-containing protein [Oligoflexia bacterium]|nr:GGDEF domain-containing protein [Oligoflexia bacterium]